MNEFNEVTHDVTVHAIAFPGGQVHVTKNEQGHWRITLNVHTKAMDAEVHRDHQRTQCLDITALRSVTVVVKEEK